MAKVSELTPKPVIKEILAKYQNGILATFAENEDFIKPLLNPNHSVEANESIVRLRRNLLQCDLGKKISCVLFDSKYRLLWLKAGESRGCRCVDRNNILIVSTNDKIERIVDSEVVRNQVRLNGEPENNDKLVIQL